MEVSIHRLFCNTAIPSETEKINKKVALISVKFYNSFWDWVLLVSFNECTNTKRLTQSGSKDLICV